MFRRVQVVLLAFAAIAVQPFDALAAPSSARLSSVSRRRRSTARYRPGTPARSPLTSRPTPDPSDDADLGEFDESVLEISTRNLERFAQELRPVRPFSPRQSIDVRSPERVHRALRAALARRDGEHARTILRTFLTHTFGRTLRRKYDEHSRGALAVVDMPGSGWYGRHRRSDGTVFVLASRIAGYLRGRRPELTVHVLLHEELHGFSSLALYRSPEPVPSYVLALEEVITELHARVASAHLMEVPNGHAALGYSLEIDDVREVVQSVLGASEVDARIRRAGRRCWARTETYSDPMEYLRAFVRGLRPATAAQEHVLMQRLSTLTLHREGGANDGFVPPP